MLRDSNRNKSKWMIEVKNVLNMVSYINRLEIGGILKILKNIRMSNKVLVS